MTGARSTAVPKSGSGVPPLNAEETFTPDQLAWLGLIRNHIATKMSLDPEDFEYMPFGERGGLGKAHQPFGEQLPKLLDELNEVLAA
jgi:type I restriction enzyme R subunit